jgi:hypothetical protein
MTDRNHFLNETLDHFYTFLYFGCYINVSLFTFTANINTYLVQCIITVQNIDSDKISGASICFHKFFAPKKRIEK